MEHNENIGPEEVLRRAFLLTPKEGAVLVAMLGGLSDAAVLRAVAEVSSHGALRKHICLLRDKLPCGGVNSSRLPTRYWLTGEAVGACREVLGILPPACGEGGECSEPGGGARAKLDRSALGEGLASRAPPRESSPTRPALRAGHPPSKWEGNRP